jgi:hypothetical protein
MRTSGAALRNLNVVGLQQGRMIARISLSQSLPRAATVLALLVLGIGLAGCADMSDGMLNAFSDPAKYDLYECKQIEAERKSLSTRAAELQGLMAKANTGVGGPVVVELAYRNDYISVRRQAKLADEAWQRNKCRPSPPAVAADAPGLMPVPPPAHATRRRPQGSSGSAVY